MIKKGNLKKENPFYRRLNYLIDNKIVGYVEYAHIYEKMEIENIFVKEEYRNQKIATKLMQKIINIALENDIYNITLEVRKSNKIAIKLYENFNFKQIAERKNYYGDEDALLMEMKVKQ